MRYYFKKDRERDRVLTWLSAIVLLLGVLSGTVFWWLNHLNFRYQQIVDLVESVYEIDRQVALSHLWLYEQPTGETELIEPLLNDTVLASVALTRQLHDEDGGLEIRERREELLAEANNMTNLLIDLKAIVIRAHVGSDVKKFSDSEHIFDAKYRLFMRSAKKVEEIIDRNRSIRVRFSLTMFRLIFAGWILLVAVLVLLLVRVESRRLATLKSLAESEEKFRTIAESARDAIVLVNGQGGISYWNRAADRMFGKSSSDVIGGKLCDILLPPTSKIIEHDNCVGLWQPSGVEKRDKSVIEIQVNSANGSFPVEISVAPIILDDQQQNIAIIRDVSARKIAEKALRDNESLLRTLINAIPDFVCFKDGEGRWLMANEFALRLFHVEEVDYRNKNDLELAEYNNSYREAFLGCMRSDKETWQAGTLKRFDEQIPRLEGAPLTFDTIKVPLYNDDRSRKGLLVIGRDISERMIIQKALKDSEEQLRHLSASLFVVQETERRRIANELHDELGQALVALKMQVRAMQRHLAEERPAENQECDEICEHIDQIVENVRRLSRDLSPVVLDDLGLGTALRHMVDKFSELHDIDVNVHMDEINNLFTPGIERIVYRIIQEALTNIVKHANARNVDFSALRTGRGVRFLVKDDGSGFDPEAVAGKEAARRGLGLTAMSERMRMLGGIIDIESHPGHGTNISMLVPVHNC